MLKYFGENCVREEYFQRSRKDKSSVCVSLNLSHQIFNSNLDISYVNKHTIYFFSTKFYLVITEIHVRNLGSEKFTVTNSNA